MGKHALLLGVQQSDALDYLGHRKSEGSDARHFFPVINIPSSSGNEDAEGEPEGNPEAIDQDSV